MDNNTFTFELRDLLSPDAVVEKALEQIAVATKGYVEGHIESYRGPISSYRKKSSIKVAVEALSETTIDVDIQKELGKLDKQTKRFEVYLSVKGLEHYKYRLLFMEFGTISYPVTVVMNSTLALEYSGKTHYTFKIESMDELESMMNKILNCSTMYGLIQSLINEALRQEYASRDEDSLDDVEE